MEAEGGGGEWRPILFVLRHFRTKEGYSGHLAAAEMKSVCLLHISPTLEQGFASHSVNVRSLQIEIYCDFWQHCVRSLQSPLVIKYLCLGHPHFTAAQ